MTIDLDSTICELHGKHKHGAAYGYTCQLGCHPVLGVDAGAVLHARLRTTTRQPRPVRRDVRASLLAAWERVAVPVE